MGLSRRAWRLLLLIVVVAGIAPGTWLRSQAGAQAEDDRQILTFEALPLAVGKAGEFEIAGGWELRSSNRHFGSYSAMVPLGGGRFLAISDNGHRLEFTPPGEGAAAPQFDYFTVPVIRGKRYYDAESLTRDAETGRFWAGYEGNNSILRLDSGLRVDGRISPRAMDHWPENGGPEAMVRLRDGRFIVLAENDPGWLSHDSPGLLFPGDPIEGYEPVSFRFKPPSGFLPVDMAQLPDGKVLILLRRLKWRIPQSFANKLMIADPATIRADGRWDAKVVAEIDHPLPTDNYEGLAITPEDSGGYAAWLISDDNSSGFQRTLLLKLVRSPD